LFPQTTHTTTTTTTTNNNNNNKYKYKYKYKNSNIVCSSSALSPIFSPRIEKNNCNNNSNNDIFQDIISKLSSVPLLSGSTATTTYGNSSTTAIDSLVPLGSEVYDDIDEGIAQAFDECGDGNEWPLSTQDANANNDVSFESDCEDNDWWTKGTSRIVCEGYADCVLEPERFQMEAAQVLFSKEKQQPQQPQHQQTRQQQLQLQQAQAQAQAQQAAHHHHHFLLQQQQMMMQQQGNTHHLPRRLHVLQRRTSIPVPHQHQHQHQQQHHHTIGGRGHPVYATSRPMSGVQRYHLHN